MGVRRLAAELAPRLELLDRFLELLRGVNDANGALEKGLEMLAVEDEGIALPRSWLLKIRRDRPKRLRAIDDYRDHVRAVQSLLGRLPGRRFAPLNFDLWPSSHTQRENRNEAKISRILREGGFTPREIGKLLYDDESTLSRDRVRKHLLN